jgi:hypothetical protein
MAKGLFTQGIAVLCRGVPRIPQIASKLAGFQVVGERPASSEWSMGGPALVLEFRPAVNGYIVVDIVNRQWPDDMGNPKKDATLFASWSMGHFGPYAYPSNLSRAVQQSWSWRGAESAATSHDSFVRIRTTYVLGAEPDAKVLPADYEPSAELLAITRVAQAILQLPNALCYFNPNGETLKRRSEVNELLERHTGTGMLPLELGQTHASSTLAERPRGTSWTPWECGSSMSPITRRAFPTPMIHPRLLPSFETRVTKCFKVNPSFRTAIRWTGRARYAGADIVSTRRLQIRHERRFAGFPMTGAHRLLRHCRRAQPDVARSARIESNRIGAER